MIYDENDLCFLCVCVLNLLQDIHQFALRQIDVYLSQARAQENTHHYLLITPYILIQTLYKPLSIIDTIKLYPLVDKFFTGI